MIDPRLFAYIAETHINVNAGEKMMLFALAHYWETANQRATPTVKELAIFCVCEPVTVQTRLEVMEYKDLIKVYRLKNDLRRLRIVVPMFLDFMAADDNVVMGPVFFDVFWQEYPRKVQRGLAFSAMRRIEPTLEQQNQMLDSLAQFKVNDWFNAKKKDIPMASTWLRQRQWEKYK